MGLIRVLASSAMLLLTVGCSMSGASKQNQQMKAAASLARTAVLTLDAWRSGSAPSHYARRTVRMIGETLSGFTGSESSGSSAALQQQREQTRQALAQAEKGIRASDPAVVERARNTISDAASKLEERRSQ